MLPAAEGIDDAGERSAQWKRKLENPQVPIRDVLGKDFFDKD